MSIYTQRSGASAHPETMLDFLMSRVIEQSGVERLGNSNMLVAEQASPNMSVQINLGNAFIRKSDGSKVYPVRIADANESVNISANGTGNSRIDALVLYVDLGASPNSSATNVAKLIAVEGTPAGSPTAPTDGDIETAIGASNPYIRLANILVTSGATGIEDADITDTRVRATKVKASKDYYELTDASTVDIDFENGTKQFVVLTANRTLGEPTNMQAGDELWLKLTQDAGGGNTVTWWSDIAWANGEEPELSADGDASDIIGIVKKADGTYEGGIIWQGIL